MPNVTSITLDALVFNNEGTNANGTTLFVDRSSEYATGFRTLTQRSKGPAAGGNYHSMWKVTSPEVKAAADAQGPAGMETGRSIVDIHAALSPTLSTAQRQNVYDRILSLVQSQAFIDSIVSMKPAI